MKNILIFGASRGIGRVFAQRRLENGDKVYVFSRSWEKRVDKEPEFVKCDFCNPEDVINKLKNLLLDIKVIDSVVFTQRYRGDDYNWDKEINSSIVIFKTILEFLFPYIKENGSVVAISSNAAHSIAVEQPVSYHASKAALEQMIRYYAVKFGSKKIRVNGISPAITLKPENIKFYNEEKNKKEMFSKIIPLGRMCEADDVSNAIDFFIEDFSSFITGQIITIDGGLSLMTPEVYLRNK